MANAKELFNLYIDNMHDGATFHPRDVIYHISRMTNGRRRPHDGTITRYIRERRAKRNDVELVDSAKSKYRKKGC